MNNNDLKKYLESIATNITPKEDFLELMNSNKKLKIKLGADPSRPDLHLGHSVIFRALKKFQDLGHEIIFVIGDFTAMIGDPTGKNVMRPTLTHEETIKNSKSYMEQVFKILDKEKTKVYYNSQWLNKLDFAQIMDLCSKYTLARILERDDFKYRYNNNSAIGIHELIYPLLQGYDSVYLESDIETGGNDQIFNLLVGRELQRSYNKKTRQVAITFPLLIGLCGKDKMSKSLKNDISINNSAFEMYEKCMKIPDNLLIDYFKLTTDIDKSKYEIAIQKDIYQAHFLYADYIVNFFHGENELYEAKNNYINISKNKLPDNFETLYSDDNISIVDLLYNTKITKSKSEARRLIEGKGVKINNILVDNINLKVNIANKGIILSKGKKYYKIIKNSD